MPPADRDGRSGESRRRKPDRSVLWARLLMGLAVGVAVVIVARAGADHIPALLRKIDHMGPWAAVAFVALYAGAAVAWVPGSILTLAAGAIFGLLRGTTFTIVGATLGASLAFLVARYIARGTIERRVGDSPKLRAVDEAIEREGAKVVFLIRLSPIFPYNALNYALGLTRVRFRDYVPASAIGMIPGTFMYVYAGHAAGQIAAGTAGAGPQGPSRYILLGVGLLATVAVTVLVTRTARRALEKTTDIGRATEQVTDTGAASSPSRDSVDRRDGAGFLAAIVMLTCGAAWSIGPPAEQRQIDRMPEARIGDALPPGWEFRAVRGADAPDSEVTDETGRREVPRAVRFEAEDQAGFFWLELERPLDPAREGLRWSWRVDAAVEGSRLRAPDVDDSPARFFVVFGRGDSFSSPNDAVTAIGFMIDTDQTGAGAVSLLGPVESVTLPPADFPAHVPPTPGAGAR